MVAKWDPQKMDFLICISPLERCHGSVGKGDFDSTFRVLVEMVESGKLNEEENVMYTEN